MPARGHKREFPRSARVGELLREIIAAEVERIDDDRLLGVAITSVDVDNELEKAIVYFDADDAAAADEALEESSGRLRKAVSGQARIRRTPRLEFELDRSISTGNRIEEILGSLDIPPAED